MRSVSTTEKELKERIKELTCLYEVTSLIINANLDQVDVTLKAITKSLKKALQFPKSTQVFIDIEEYSEEKSKTKKELCIISSTILVFNIPKGKISAFIKGKELKDNLYLKEVCERSWDSTSFMSKNLISLGFQRSTVTRNTKRVDPTHSLVHTF